MIEPPARAPGSPDAVVARLASRAVCVRSVWFPSRAEVAAWNDAGTPLYVRPLGPGRLEVGPRLGAMWASVFSPVLVGELGADGSGATTLRWERRLTGVTRAVLAFWAVSVALWGVSMALGLQRAGLPFWMVTAACTAVAPAVGWTRGGSALDAGLPWLAEALAAPDGEDW